VKNMVFKKKAKKTTKRRSAMPKKKTYRKKASSSKIDIGAAVVSSIVSPMVREQVAKLTGDRVDVSTAMTALGYFASKKAGMVGKVGVALFYANADQAFMNLKSGGLLGGVGVTDGGAI